MGQLVAHNGGSARVPTVRRAPDDQGSAIPNGPADLNIYARPLAPVNIRICHIEFVILAVTPIAGHGGEGDRREPRPARSGCHRGPGSTFRSSPRAPLRAPV